VKAGAELVSGAGGTIHSLVSSVKEVAELIEQISTTMAAQGHSINSVAQVVSVIDGTVQENAAMVEESAAASSSLREQANALAELMRVFKLETPPPRSESSAGTYSIGTSASPRSLVHRGTRALPVPTSAH
ncbi:MAG TPA: methyl-accepting chemotaxis protein, partial [Acidovorax sp.]|nr:methyl-accepting chemotaxis protein [Acidovorax sp.]